MFFNSWYSIARVIIIGTMSYFALVLLLRVSGKRTLAKMNMFDFVITIALGSVFATLILSKSVALADGVTGLILLVVLQYFVAWLSVRFKSFQRLVKGSPTLLFYRGQYLEDVMRSERIAVDEIRFAARSQGVANMDDLFAIVLETDGTFSVIPQANDPNHNALTDLKGGQKDNA